MLQFYRNSWFMSTVDEEGVGIERRLGTVHLLRDVRGARRVGDGEQRLPGNCNSFASSGGGTTPQIQERLEQLVGQHDLVINGKLGVSELPSQRRCYVPNKGSAIIRSKWTTVR